MKQAVKSVEEVKAILKEHKAEVVQKYRVSEIGIFGSFVRGEQRKKVMSISLSVSPEPLTFSSILISRII